MEKDEDLKSRVMEFWDEKSCGEVYAEGESEREYYESQSLARYSLEPYIRDFARFGEGAGKDVLEIGVGMGADHLEWAKSRPRSLTGIDLTPRAVVHTQRQLELSGYHPNVQVGDAEALPFPDGCFDIVYSWGVLHHSPDTAAAFGEVFRVLRSGGAARIMVYHKYALTGYMLWLRYGLLRGRPLRPLRDIYATHLESPGTKAYTVAEVRAMCSRYSRVDIRIQLSFGDLLQGAVGQRHGGRLLDVARKIWPRRLLARMFRHHGLCMLIEARKG
ncbi:MAG: methyltransferase domain-containing protein [Bacteroidetes bacterium]|nr:methyltransferase domain-containing protein [Bacteroidota bacterium]